MTIFLIDTFYFSLFCLSLLGFMVLTIILQENRQLFLGKEIMKATSIASEDASVSPKHLISTCSLAMALLCIWSFN